MGIKDPYQPAPKGQYKNSSPPSGMAPLSGPLGGGRAPLRGKVIKDMEKYRLAAKNLALTYPNCELTKEEVLELLQCKLAGNLESYVISKEKHETGLPHIHVYLKLDKLINIRSEHYFDLKEYHGNYQSVKSKGNWIEYIMKGGDFITNLAIKDGKILKYYDQLINLVKEGKLETALKELESNGDSKDLLKNYSRYRSNLIDFNSKVNPPLNRSKYKKGDYNFPKEILD